MTLPASNLPATSFRPALMALVFACSAGMSGAQTTYFVDDDHPNDPVPGITHHINNAFSNPLEDGSPENPFDDIWKAVAVATTGDEVLVLPSNALGAYFLTQTLDLAGKAITIRSQGGPSVTSLDGTNIPGQPGVLASSGETSITVFEGFTLENFNRGASTGDHGAALDILNSHPTIRDCVFTSNHAYRGAAIHVMNSASRIEDCLMDDNTSVHQGGAVFTESGTPTFSRCQFSANTANFGGAFTSFTSGGQVTVEDCVFLGNESLVGYGGALSSHFSGTITVERSRFLANTCATFGGAMFIEQGLVSDCTFNSNVSILNEAALSAGTTGAVVVQGSTFFGNIGGACGESSSGALSVRNSICWNNTPYEIEANVSVASCDVLGGYAGANNIDVDPLFANPQGPDGIFGTLDDNLSLFEGSPCIDAGDTTQLPPGYPKDLLGRSRAVDFPDTPDTGTALVGHTIDMGAYEYPAPEAVDPNEDHRVKRYVTFDSRP